MQQLETRVLASMVVLSLIGMPVYAWLSHQQEWPDLPVEVVASPAPLPSRPTTKPPASASRKPEPLPLVQPKPAQPLKGDVLLLVLQTQSKPSHLDTLAFHQQLLAIKTDLGPRLLGGSIHRLQVGGWEEWQPVPLVADGERFRNADYDRLFQAAFRAIDELTTRAENKRFRTVLLWESDRDPVFDPELQRKKVQPPAGRTVGLCYWFVNSQDESKVVGTWFGPTNVVRPPRIADVRDYVLELVRP